MFMMFSFPNPICGMSFHLFLSYESFCRVLKFSSLGHVSAIEICVLIFNPTTLLNSFLYSDDSLGFSRYKICVLQKVIILSFSIFLPLISFSYVIALAIIYTIILNNSDDNGDR